MILFRVKYSNDIDEGGSEHKKSRIFKVSRAPSCSSCADPGVQHFTRATCVRERGEGEKEEVCANSPGGFDKTKAGTRHWVGEPSTGLMGGRHIHNVRCQRDG